MAKRLVVGLVMGLCLAATARLSVAAETPAPAGDEAGPSSTTVPLAPGPVAPAERPKAEPSTESEAPKVPATSSGVDAVDFGLTDEIQVFDDLFARWDGTRWLVETEIGVPMPMTFGLENNLQVETHGFQARAVIACSKQWRMSKRKYEVDCLLEDVALQISSRHPLDQTGEKRKAQIQEIADTVDAKLTGAKLILQVTADGQVVNVGLDGVDVTNVNRRTNLQRETMRQLLLRLMVGFDMKLRKYNMLKEGRWVEYNTALMSMPESQASQGSSMTVHYLNKYKGQVVVQSIGQGSMTAADNIFMADLIGVSVFDASEGFMTERVWALDARATAGSMLGQGREAPPYWHAGRITMLGENDRPDLGTSGQVSQRGREVEGLPSWKSIE